MTERSALGRQSEVFLGGVRGVRPAVPMEAGRLEERARRVMRPEAFAYVAGGAGNETTVRANREAFDRWRIVPRMLRDVSVRDTRTTLLGKTLPAPLVVAPVGVLELAHPEADGAVARACAAAGVPMIYSSQASVPMEVCAASMGVSPRWFQLYWSRSDDLVESFVHRAEACRCDAIVVTLDTTMLGWRPRDLELGYLPFLQGKGIAQYVTDPVFNAMLDAPALPDTAKRPRANAKAVRALMSMTKRYPAPFLATLRSKRALRAVQQFIATYSRPSLTWDDLPFLRKRTRLPIVLKGILHPDDARRAVEAGVDGVIVSNHGGRQVDGAIASLDALPGVVEAVGGAIPVLMDSGVRGGADAFRAVALGAAAVCIGRPYVYALAIAGEAGVRQLLHDWMADFELTMGLAGCATIADIGRDAVVRI